MTEDPRSELAEVLAQDGPAVALRALRCALRWSARALADVTGATAADRDVAALEVVIALDDALDEVSAIADRLTPLTELAVTGTPVAEHLERQVEALIELADRAAVARREHQALARTERELRAGAAEHQRISDELDQLRRYQRLADAVPELQAQQQVLAARLAALRSPAPEAERALLDTAEQVLTLSDERLADLNRNTAAVLGELAEVQRGWARESANFVAQKERLDETVKRYRRLRDLQTERVAALLEYRRIDGELVAAIPGADGEFVDARTLSEALERVEETLRQVDDGLRAALEQHGRRVETDLRLVEWDEPVHGGVAAGDRS